MRAGGPQLDADQAFAAGALAAGAAAGLGRRSGLFFLQARSAPRTVTRVRFSVEVALAPFGSLMSPR